MAQAKTGRNVVAGQSGELVAADVERFDGADLIAGLRLVRVAPEKTLEAVLKDAYGDSGPQALDQLRRSCSKIVTDLLVYRPDLSYIPK